MEQFWSPDRKVWSPTYFICNLHKNTILYVTLDARKVTIEERKQLETTRVTFSYKATVVLRWYVSGAKVMVVSIVILNEAKHKTFQVRGFHCETKMGPCIFSLCCFFEMPFFIFDLLSLMPFLRLIGSCRHSRGKWKAHGVEVRLRSQFRKKPLKQYGAPWTQYRHVEIHSIFSIIL